MDQRELAARQRDAIMAALDELESRVWTSMPGTIQSFNAEAMTAEVQPAIQGIQRAKDGTTKLVNMPLCVDCPVIFPGGGGFTLTFPVAQGDECLLVFADRAIDSWWQQGGIQPPIEYRMHDLSDGFCLVGVRNLSRVLAGLSADSVQLRSDDGSTYLEVKNGQLVNVVAPGGINLNGVMIDSSGNVSGIKDLTTTGNTSLGGGSEKVVLDGDPVSGGVVHASSTKTKAT